MDTLRVERCCLFGKVLPMYRSRINFLFDLLTPRYRPTSHQSSSARLSTTFTMIPNLERIEFNRTYALTPRVVTILSPIANKITTLNLSSTKFASPHDFWPLICSFPNLSTVQTCDVTYESMEGAAFFLSQYLRTPHYNPFHFRLTTGLRY